MAVLNQRDLRIDTFSGGGHGAVFMRITHLPSGISVSEDGESLIRLREELLTRLAIEVEKAEVSR